MQKIGMEQPLSILRGDSPAGKAGKEVQKGTFADLLKHSIHEVDQVQKDAVRAAENLAVGKTENIHETMIALKKAELSFKMMMQVRNKIVKAYEEIMRMQV
ncbi:MAG: flagellar hook-basal body complex protein FliE [Deltaproteobacteria bacterium]|nr:flagellar hook-basal body complex protein FliE [Deltaproteobacteria bacterium]